MFKWLVKKWTYENQWKCIWKKCGWESFDNGDGKLHWWCEKR